ncbi:recombinase family protein [Singulisphaera sp. Ch08]|uniref:Recombinase family protein n=1 Tax=Singulisphaera sp. Ch08 TaxID=3120278 RepID=A0AAU7CEM0_9BACT
MRAAVYARVSTAKQGRDQTILSQLDALRAWAQANSHDLKEDHVFIDEGYSGSRLDRPALDRLRDAAREGEFDVVAVFSPDRLARRYAYQILLLEEFRRAACEVEFVHRPISDDPHDQLLLQIQGAIAEYERAVLAERFRRGKIQKAKDVHWIAGKAPYGYRYVPARDGVPAHLEVEEAEADVVRILYRWLIDERVTVRQILKRLAEGPWRPRCGRRLWSPSVVHRVLSDPVYIGEGYLNRHVFVVPRKPRSKGIRAGTATCRRPRPREEWIPIRAPALIDTSTHQDAKEQLARNSSLSFRNNTRNSYLLRCLLTCRTCGLAMFGITTYGGAGQATHRYYKCHGKDTVARDRACRCTQTPAKVAELDAAVWDHVKSLLEDPGMLAAQFEGFLGASQAREDGQSEVRRWELQLQRLDREEQRLVDAYQAEVIDLAELKARREKIQWHRHVLATQRDQEQRLHAERQAAKAVWADLKSFCRRVCDRLDEATFTERQGILQLLIDRVIVGEDSLEIRHVIPLGHSGGEASRLGPDERTGPSHGEGDGSEVTSEGRPNCRLRSDGVSPADLPPGRHDPVIGAESVAGDDLAVLTAQQRPGDRATAVLGDREDRGQASHRHPQPDLAKLLTPRRLVDVRHLGLMDRQRQFVVGSLQSRGRLPFQLGDHPGGDRQGKQIGTDLLDLPFAETIGPGEHGQDGLKVRAETTARDTGGQGAAGRLTASGTGETMKSIFIDEGLDLGQFGHLMDQRLGVVAPKPLTASATRLRLAVDGLAQLLRRHQGTVGFAMSRLPTALLAAGRSGRPPLQADRIRRRWLGRVGGVELEPCFEIADPRFQVGVPLLHRHKDCSDGGLSVGRHRTPEVVRDGQRIRHNADIVPSSATFNTGL